VTFSAVPAELMGDQFVWVAGRSQPIKKTAKNIKIAVK